MHIVRHVHVLDHGYFTDIVSALAIQINDLDMWKNIEKDTTEIVYDNKNLHRRHTAGIYFIYQYIVLKDNDLAVKI